MDLRGKSYVRLKLQTFAYFVYNASCAVSRCLGRFLLFAFLDAFLFDLMLSISSISLQFDGVRLVRLRLENFPRIQWAIFVASRSGPGSEPCVSLVGGMTQLIAALMSCKKLLKI